MKSASVGGFLRDDAGGGTIWGLFWFVLMVGICGLAVDSTDGFRNRTMLQATADSAALAAAIDLPDAGAAVSSAVAYASANMATGSYGDVLRPEDVTVGTFDRATGSFSPGGLLPDAVMVRLQQTEDNDNAVPVNFLRMIGLASWNVRAEAIAIRYIPECLRDGLIARGIVDISSNNGFVNKICVHGQQGVHMQNHNYFEPGVNVSMPDVDTQLVTPAGGMTSNPGLPQALREQKFDPRMVNHVDEIMADLLLRKAYVTPDYIDADLPVIVKNEKWNFGDATAGRIYHIQCSANKNVGIPSNKILRDVVIVADCQIGVGAGARLSNVVLASRSGGNSGGGNGGGGNGNGGGNSGGGGAGISNANINFSSGVSLGDADNCQPGGGVQIFSNASVHFSSSMTINGLQVVAAGDVDLGARDMGVNGITVQTGGNITLTSNNMFGLCSGGAPDLFTVGYYRLVH